VQNSFDLKPKPAPLVVGRWGSVQQLKGARGLICVTGLQVTALVTTTAFDAVGFPNAGMPLCWHWH